MGKPKILVTRRLPAQVEARMATLFDARFNETDAPLSANDLVAQLAGKDVLVSSITDRLDVDLIGRLPESVKLIAQFGNGFDNIDIDAAYARGLIVTNTPSVLRPRRIGVARRRSSTPAATGTPCEST